MRLARLQKYQYSERDIRKKRVVKRSLESVAKSVERVS